MSIAYYNGRFTSLDEAKIPLSDRAVFFGDGIYEVILARNEKMHFPEMHIKRFFENVRLLSIPFDMSAESLYALLRNALLLSGEDCAMIYFQLTKFSEARRHACPKTDKYNLLITVTPQQLPTGKKRLRLITYPDLRYRYCNIKTLNLIPAVIASEYAERNGADEAVLCRGETVTECAHSNISVIKDGILYTHPKCELILPGTAREALLAECKRLGIPYREEPFSKAMLYSAEAALVTSSTKICMLAESCDGSLYRDKCEPAELLCENMHKDFIEKTV
jgi:D-alanine transaminase